MTAAFETARDFAQHGHPVFAAHTVGDDGAGCSCGRDCGSPAKHPRTRNGLKDATTDERVLLAWDARFPGSNWAVACGDRFSVLDIDPKHGADPHEVIGANDLAGPTVWTGEALGGALAGQRGAHVYCLNGVRTGPTSLAGVEVRAAGAYVLLPGSRHSSGVAYEWSDDARPWTSPLVAVPEALSPQNAREAPRASAIGETIPAGQRDTVLTSLAGTMRRRGMHEAAIAAALLATNRDRCRPPLSDAEVEKVARSVARYAPATHVTASTDELTGLFGLEQVNRRVDLVRLYGRGSEAAAHIVLDDGERIVLRPLAKFGSAVKLIHEVALQAGAAPALKGPDVTRIMVLLRLVGEQLAAFESDDQAREWAAEYLRAAPVQAVDMTDQVSRWQAFEVLDRIRPWREDVASVAGGTLVLEDVKTGIRYVRAEWLRAFARSKSSTGEAATAVAAMTSLGWSRPGREGRVKATAPGRPGTLQWAFFTVPAGWEDA